jgi:hypothetical protein
MTPPPTIVQDEEMISLSLRLIQEGKQENQLIKVKQVPANRAEGRAIHEAREARERVEIQKVECPLRPSYEYTLRRVDRRHPRKPTDFTLGEN